MTTSWQRCVPFLQVADARRSSRFYCDILGFQQEWDYQPDAAAPIVVAIRKNDVRLFLTEHPESAVGMLIYCYVDDVDQLYHHLIAHQVEPEWPPTDTPWNTREMQIRDVDGNKLRFGRVG
jgi:uncharacterized glyoxalase superfamily protein PhnB